MSESTYAKFQPRVLTRAIKNTILLTATVSLSSLVHSAELEEVVVTAQHRAENVQDVPIAVSAIGAEELKKADIFDAGSIAKHVPGMAYAEFAPGQANISMRGISSIDDGAGLDNSVALFLDGVYIGRGASINFDMFDLERLEVLRGPQGTLFGRNAIGGAISVVSSKPTDTLGVKLGATIGNEGIVRYQGLANVPLTDSLNGKITINHRQHDGYVRNVLLNKDQQDEDQTSVRGQLLMSLDSSEWLLSADFMEDDREDMGRTPIVNGNFDYVGTWRALGGGVRKSTAPIDGFSKRKANGISLQGDIEFDTGTLTTITAVRHAETDWEMASIGAPAGGGYNFGDPNDPTDDVYGVDVNDDIVEDIDTVSQEVRWTSNLKGNFNYTGGLFLFQEKADRIEQFKLDRNTFATGQVTVGNEYTRTQNETTSYALYGQGSWELNEKWSVTLGGRYTVDKKDYIATAVNCGLVKAGDASVIGTKFENFAACGGVGSSLGIIAEVFEVNPSDDWNDFSPKIAIEYHPSDDVMIFSSASKGFKSGGFAGSQGVKIAASKSVDPETAYNYELGFKGDFLDSTLRFNATAFYTDYQDLQIVRFGPVPGTSFGAFQTTNLGTAEMKGVEVEFTWLLSENLTLSGNHAYLDSEVNDLVLVTAGGEVDASGSPLRQAPRNSSSLVLSYNVATDVGEFDARLEYSHTSEQLADYINQATTIDAVGLFDGRVAWISSDEQWEVALWGKNLKDDDYISHSFVIGPGVIGTWGAPRTIGLTVNYSL